MYSQRKVIDRIREILQRQAQLDSPEVRDLAQQYADVCRETRDRLATCAGYLARGLRAEAKHVAEQEPALIELARILQDDALGQWPELCLSCGLPEPPAVPHDLVEMLETAFAGQGREALALDRLQRQFRRAALIGSTGQKVHALRSVRLADPKNPIWTQDLKGFEEYRIKEIASEMAEAFQKRDEPVLGTLRIELSSADWVANKPTSELVQECTQKHRAIRRIRLGSKGKEVAQRIAQARSASDFKEADEGLMEWDALSMDEDFECASTDKDLVEQVKKWHSVEKEQRKQTADFEAALHQLRRDLDECPTSKGLEESIGRASSFQRPIPTELSDRTKGRLESLHKLETRRLFLKVAALVALVCILSGTSVAIGRYISKRNERSSWISRVDDAISNARWMDAEKIASEAVAAVPDLGKDAELNGRKAHIQKELESIDQKRAQFQEIIGGTQVPKESELTPKAAATLLDKLKGAERLVQDESDTALLNQCKKGILEAVQAYQSRVDKQFEDAIAEVRPFADSLKALDPALDQDRYESTLLQAERKYKELSDAGDVSPKLRESASRIGNTLTDARTRYTTAVRSRHDREKWLEALATALPNLTYFDQVLRELGQRKDLTEKDQLRIKALLDLTQPYQEAARSSEWAFAQDKDSFVRITELLSQSKGKNSPWEITLTRTEENLRLLENVSAFKRALDGWKFVASLHQVKQLKVATKEKEEGADVVKTFYFYEDPKDRGGGTEKHLFEFWSLQGARDVKPERVTLPPALMKPVLVPHAEYLSGLPDRLFKQSQDQMDSFFWQEIQSISKNEDFNPIVGMVFAKEMLKVFQIAENRFPLELKTLASTNDRWMRFNDNRDWLRKSDPDVQQAEREGKKNLTAIVDPGFKKAVDEELRIWKYHRELWLQALNRKIACVGQYVKNSDQSFKIANRFTGKTTELWALQRPRSAEDGWFALVAERDEDGWKKRSDFKGELIDGQPLFAPTDGRPTLELAKTLAQRHGLSTSMLNSQVQWPPSWPVNGRPTSSK